MAGYDERREQAELLAAGRTRLINCCSCWLNEPGTRARSLLLALARPHHGASTGCSRAAGLASACRDLQLLCSSATSSVLLWRRTSKKLAVAQTRSPPGGGLSARRHTLSSVLRHQSGGSTQSAVKAAVMCHTALHNCRAHDCTASISMV